MHIAVDCRSIHRHMGGIGRAALELMRALSNLEREHRLSMIVGRDPGAELPGGALSVVPVDAAMIDESFEQLRLPSLLAEIRADLYVNTTFSIPAVKTTPYQASIIHDVVFEDRPEFVEPGLRSYLSRWSRFAAQEADHIFTVSDHARSRIRSVYGVPESRVSRVYNAVPQSCYSLPDPRDTARVREKFRLQDPFILYLGTVESKKGIPELLDAFARLAVTGFAGQLVLAGGRGSDQQELEKDLEGKGLTHRVRLLGYVEEMDKKPLLKACRCFVYPSHYEGFGLPPLEAMALGVPCVVSDQTSLPEVVGEAAIIASLHDPLVFAQALRKACDDAGFREAAARQGPARAARFSWEDSAARFVSVCEDVGGT